MNSGKSKRQDKQIKEYKSRQRTRVVIDLKLMRYGTK